MDAQHAAPDAAISDLPPDLVPASARNGTRTAGPARGVFPAGCRWRTVKYSGEAKRPFWSVEEYEWWDAASGVWVAQQPAACLVPGKLQRRGCVAGHTPSYRNNKILLCLHEVGTNKAARYKLRCVPCAAQQAEAQAVRPHVFWQLSRGAADREHFYAPIGTRLHLRQIACAIWL